MNLLYLMPRQVWDTKMSRVRMSHAKWLGSHDRVEIRVSGPGWPGWDDGISPAENVRRLKINGEPVSTVLTYKVGGLAGCDVPVVIAYNEAFEYDAVNREVADVGASIVIFHHAPDLPRYAHLDDLGISRIHIPHSADPEVYRDWGQSKDIDVLVAGNLSQHYYPFRHRLMRIAVTVLRRRAWRVVVLKHPGYTLPAKDGTVVGAEFAKTLNRAKLVLTCSMRFKYQLAKYAEIAMCRSLPVGDMPDECAPCTARLEKMLLRVEPWMPDAEIVREIETALEDDDALAKRTAVACEVASTQLSMKQYAERFCEAVEPLAERIVTERKRRHESEQQEAASRRAIMRADVPSGTKAVCAYLDDASRVDLTLDEAAALTNDHVYTVESVHPSRAAAYVRLREIPAMLFPIWLFREGDK